MYPILVRDNPGKYAATLAQMAELDPALYPALGAFQARHDQQDEAAQAYLKVIELHLPGTARAEGPWAGSWPKPGSKKPA